MSQAAPHTLWFTGLSGAGKSTVAQALHRSLQQRGIPSQIIDGDELRTGLCKDLGFSRADRSENIRRAAEVCKLLNQAGVIAIGALISPYREDRALAGQIIGPDHFAEIWFATPLAICEQRDPKGLYRRARAGLIPTFTGISDPYEAPEAPHLNLNTAATPLADCVTRLEALLKLNPTIQEKTLRPQRLSA